MILEFKDLTFGCNITDKDNLRVYKVVGWDSAKGSVDAIHHLNKITASISNFKGIELTNEVLNTCDVLLVSDNFFSINDLAVTSQKPFVYLHQIQRSYLAETNEILEYKPI
jgi:hypothetical protein